VSGIFGDAPPTSNLGRWGRPVYSGHLQRINPASSFSLVSQMKVGLLVSQGRSPKHTRSCVRNIRPSLKIGLDAGEMKTCHASQHLAAVME
jgi:hypothetical protein